MPVYKDEKRKSWYVSTYVEYKDGTRKKVMKRGFKTKREATQYENELLFNSKMNTSENPLFEDVLDNYQEMYKDRMKESTVYKLDGSIRRYIRPYFKDKRVQHITKKDIITFHEFLLKKLAVSTSKDIHTDLVSILNYAKRLGYTNDNVAHEAGNIKAHEKTNVDFWLFEEFERFMKVVNSQKYRALFMVLFYGGLRIGEALALSWNDIDFDKNIIDINKRYYNTSFNTPKSKTSIRKVKMPQHTMNRLAKWKLESKPKSDYVVFGNYYKPHNQSSINQQYYKYLDEFIIDGKQTLKRIRLHDFRHSHASYLIDKGADIQVISRRLGHSKVSITYDIYAHLYPNKEDEAIAMMENDFKPAKVIKLKG